MKKTVIVVLASVVAGIVIEKAVKSFLPSVAAKIY